MKHILNHTYKIFAILFFSVSINSFSQVTVSGAVSGNGTYGTLNAAFIAINGASQNGSNILVLITSDTNEGISTATLNAGNWNSILIKPSGGNWTITGVTTAGNPLINLNGADNVTIDGLNSGGNSLTISNTKISGTAGTSTIKFINDASNNTITNCAFSGSETAAASGTIFFSSGTATGNDNNTISNCTITSTVAGLATNAIYSYGTSVTIDNSENSIMNNNIQNYFNPATSSSGIIIAANSSSWTISGNKLFQTTTRTSTSNSLIHNGIKITTPNGGGYTISNNIIGYTNSVGTGTMTYDGNVTTTLRGIDVTANATVSNIQGNTIAGIDFQTSNAATTTGIFTGIYVVTGAVNVTDNTIGSATSANSIVITSTSTNSTRFEGINVASPGITASIQNNTIAGISTGGGATNGYSIYAINTAGVSSNSTITGNTIGSSTVPNSISIGTNGITTSGICSMYGISNNATGTISMTNNIFQNCSVYGTAASFFYGIINKGGITANINYNTVSDILLTGTSLLSPLYNNTAVGTLNINNNLIKNLTNSKAPFIGIGNNGAVSGTITMNNNQLGTETEGLINFVTTNSSNVIGVYNSTTGGTATANLIIQNNDIRGITHTVQGSSSHFYISNNFATLSQNISNNTFTNLSVNTTGKVYFVYNNVALPINGSKTIDSNRVVTAFNKTGSGSSVYTYYEAATSSAVGTTITNTNNNFSNINVTGTTLIAGWNSLDVGLTTKTITGNIFNNWIAGTGIVSAMTINGFSGTSSVSNNTIGNISGQAAITGINLGVNGNASILSVANNDITGLNSTGLGGNVSGIVLNANNSNVININNSTVSSLSSTGGTSTVSGIQFSGGNGTINAYNNTVNAISSFGSVASVNGFYVTSGSNVNLYKNKIYDIALNATSTGVVIGINFKGGNTVTAYNNLIGNIKAPFSNNGTAAVRGVFVNSSILNSSYSLFNNTIFLDATSTGTNFGTSGIYHITNATATTANLILKNNIVVNNSVSNGTGKTIAFGRNNATIAKYDTSSNNNLFYAGTPSATNLIYFDGTNSNQTLTAFKTRVSPRESNSISENVSFLSTTGSDANFLHIDTTITTYIESGGVPISGITDDFDNDIRNSITPDIGADEGTFATLAPTITSLSSTNGCVGSSLIISGTNLLTVTSATIGGTTASITATTTTTATVIIGTGTTGNVAVTSPKGTGISSQTFTVYQPSVGGTVSSHQTICSGSQPADLTLTGNTGTVIKWQSSSTSDFSTGVTDIANSSTILSAAEIGNLETTTYFRAIVQNGSCTSVASSYVTITINTTTWNGLHWSNGIPTSTNQAIITGNYDTTSNPNINACSLTINGGATLTIVSTKFVTIQNNLTINTGATLNIADQGSLVMVNDTGIVTNNGTINVNKTTTPFEKYDYTYWSTPMVAANIPTTFPAWRNDYAFEFLPDNFLDTDNDGFDDNQDDWSNVTNMTPGKGYIIMGPTSGSFPRSESITFTGVINNGVINTPITLTTNTLTDDDWNLVGNPYPSAIAANDFINTNIANISGTLYFWTHKADISGGLNLGPDAANFSQDDYALYNLTGGTATATASNSGSTSPLGYIASGQGFFLEADAPAMVTFNNAMRVSLPAEANTQFFKMAPNETKTTKKNRIWLNLQNSYGMFSQQLVGYFDNATMGYDRGYDGLLNDGGNYINFYSFINNENYKIQARATFNENDLVPLGYSSAVAGTFNINIDNKEGVFENTNTKIYLEDKLLNVIHDLKQASYSFSTGIGTFNNRFVLRYTNNTLGINNFITPENQVVVSNKNNQITINSSRESIDRVVIYDVLGKKIYQKNKVNNINLIISDLVSKQQVLIVKTFLLNGKSTIKKIIWSE